MPDFGLMFFMASDSPHFGCFIIPCQCALCVVGWMRTIFGPQQSLVVLPEPHVHGRVLVRNGLGVFEGVFDIVSRQSWLFKSVIVKLKLKFFGGIRKLQGM